MSGSGETQLKSRALTRFLCRLNRNEDAWLRLLHDADKWQRKDRLTSRIETLQEEQRQKSKKIFFPQDSGMQNVASNKEQAPKHQGKFVHKARQVKLLIQVFRNIQRYAAERGGHENFSRGTAMQLKDSVVNDGEERDLLFNPLLFKCSHQVTFPKWARRVCSLSATQRTQQDIQSIVRLMAQLKDFRKYSKKMQSLLATIVRYERFGRRRVVVRKGHVGISFYIIFSGSVAIVVQGDEDKAFENDEKPAIILHKGDSFGEIALVRKTVRTATVVCLENTELLVIDKDDFYKLGVHKCVEDEMMFRCNFMKSLDLFSSWDEKVLKDVAEGGRNIEYLSEKVIDLDSIKSDFIYIITKGQCDVLRLVDLTECEKNMRRLKKENESRRTTASSLSTSPSRASQTRSPNNDGCTPTDSITAKSSISLNHVHGADSYFYNRRSRVTFCEEPSPAFAARSSANIRCAQPKSSHGSLKQRHFSGSRQPLAMPVVFERRSADLEGDRQSLNAAYGNAQDSSHLGLGTFMKIDVITQGHCFGIKCILNEEDQDDDCKRKFVLVSAGCQVIRLPKSVLRMHADAETLEKVRAISRPYPSDDELYQIFCRYNDWRCFREELVDHIAEYKSKMDKALKGRCDPIPRVPKNNDSRNVSRPETPLEQWHRILDSSQALPQLSDHMSPFLSESPPIHKSRASAVISPHSLTNQTPFIQEKLVTARGLMKPLVLTHGGSRVNRIQMETNSRLLYRKDVRHAK